MEWWEVKRGLGEALSLPAATSRLSFTMKSPMRSSSTSERSSGPEQLRRSSRPERDKLSCLRLFLFRQLFFSLSEHLLLRNPLDVLKFLSTGGSQSGRDERGEGKVGPRCLASLLAMVTAWTWRP